MSMVQQQQVCDTKKGFGYNKMKLPKNGERKGFTTRSYQKNSEVSFYSTCNFVNSNKKFNKQTKFLIN